METRTTARTKYDERLSALNDALDRLEGLNEDELRDALATVSDGDLSSLVQLAKDRALDARDAYRKQDEAAWSCVDYEKKRRLEIRANELRVRWFVLRRFDGRTRDVVSRIFYERYPQQRPQFKPTAPRDDQIDYNNDPERLIRYDLDY